MGDTVLFSYSVYTKIFSVYIYNILSAEKIRT